MEDHDDYQIPQAIKDMPEIQMVFQHMGLDDLRRTSEESIDEITNWGKPNETALNFEMTNATTDLTNFMLINMQFLPKVTMELGKWYRWRMVMSSIRNSLAFESKSGNCEFQLLAKDGIYISDAPRTVPVIMLSPGNRADVAVRCNKLGQEDMSTRSIDLGTNFNATVQYAQIMEDDPDVLALVGTFHDPESQPTIMLIDVGNEVSASSKSAKHDVDKRKLHSDHNIEPFTAPTPCYLVDLRSVSYTDIATNFTNGYGCGGTIPDELKGGRCWVNGPYGAGDNRTNRIPWQNEDTYINDFDTGTVNEIELTFSKFHPYHQHVNSYQIQRMYSTGTKKDLELDESVGIWYQVGDWHDVLQLPTVVSDGAVIIRFQADEFTGHMVQHCHILMHEDGGMMAQYDVTGDEGAHWGGAREINPRCIMKGEKKDSGN